jgi:phytoene dehydrogenase-like protein
MGSITQSMEASIRSRGVVVRTNATVVQILTVGRRATGVALANGEEIEARVVVSNLNPKLTLLDLVPSECLAPDFLARLRGLSMNGNQFKVVLALDGLPRFACARDDREALAFASCQFRIAPSMDYMERAWDDAKYGQPSHDPLFWGLTPSVIDPKVAPPGKHIMSLNIYHAPYRLRNTDWERERDAYGKRCIDVLSTYIPNLKDIIIDHRFMAPTDIEEEFGMLESNIMHGDMLPGRMFSLRPMAGLSNYRTPLSGLYLCGSGTWPGGAVTGIPGHNAAHAILSDLAAATASG